MERAITTSDDCRLTYWLRRAPDQPAPVILMVHGAASNHTRWSELVDATSLSGSWDLLRPDMRGNGRSLFRGRVDLETWSRDLAEILDEEDYPKAIVIGHSLGAQVAVRFAHDYPERVQGLVLIDPVLRQALTGNRRFLSRNQSPFRALIWTLQLLNSLGLKRHRIPDRDLRELDQRTRVALQKGESAQEISKRYSALGPILRYQPTTIYLQQLLATTAPLPDLAKIEVPVEVLLSTGITFADHQINRAALERFPDVHFSTIEANHWPLTEQPDAVREAIEEWVNERFPEATASVSP